MTLDGALQGRVVFYLVPNVPMKLLFQVETKWSSQDEKFGSRFSYWNICPIWSLYHKMIYYEQCRPLEEKPECLRLMWKRSR